MKEADVWGVFGKESFILVSLVTPVNHESHSMVKTGETKGSERFEIRSWRIRSLFGVEKNEGFNQALETQSTVIITWSIIDINASHDPMPLPNLPMESSEGLDPYLVAIKPPQQLLLESCPEGRSSGLESANSLEVHYIDANPLTTTRSLEVSHNHQSSEYGRDMFLLMLGGFKRIQTKEE